MKSIKQFYKKYMFLVNIIILILVVLVVVCIIQRPQTITNFYKNDPGNIQSIEITSGNTGDVKEITDYNQIQKVTLFLDGIKVKKNIYTQPATGWKYRVRIQEKNSEKPLEIVFAGTNSKINDKYYTITGSDFQNIVNELK